MDSIDATETAARAVFWHPAAVLRRDRALMNGHRATVVWLTGLSGSGKSTLAHAVEQRLHRGGHRTYVLDGDNVRHGLCADLDFSPADRAENVRRVAEVSRLFVEAGLIVLAAFISPSAAQREAVRRIVGEQDFLEVYCRCPLEVCRQRDPKGLYRQAETGRIKEFTGVSAPYDVPVAPALTVDTDLLPLERSVDLVMKLLSDRTVLCANRRAVPP